MSVIVTTVIIISGLFVLLAWLVIKAHKRKPMTGESGMIGEIGEVFSDFVNGMGSIRIMGEIWNAEADEKSDYTKGSKVKVVNIHDLTLKVQKI
jgi:membrane-bound serine protease (ClpP class)